MENWKNGQLIGTEPDPEPEEQHPVPPTIEEQILALQNALITSKISGGGITTVTDSSDNQIKDFKLFGKSEQVTTTGKNLFDISKLSSNMAVEITEDKLVLPQGGAIYFNSLKETSPELKIGDEVFLFGDTTSSLKQVGFHHPTISLPMWTFGNKITITKEILESSLLFYSDVSKRTVLQNIMITKENSKTYEPYTGGQPSPSPEYPQEIKSVGKWNEEKQKYDVDVKITGKNLFNKNAAKQGYEFGSAGSDGESTNQKWFVSDFMPVKATTYQISGKKTGAGCKLYNKDKVFVKNIQCPFGGIKFDEGIAYFRINGEIKDLDKIQVEEGGAPTLYEPYKEQTLTLTSDRPITKWDRLVEQGGEIGWLYCTSIKRIDNNMTWYISGPDELEKGNIYFSTIFDDAFGGNQSSFCEKFQNVNLVYEVSGKEKYGCYCDHPLATLGHKYFRTPNSTITTSEQWKDWISKNAVEIMYHTKNQEFVPLQEEEQNAIRALKTYYPTTVITIDGGEVDPDVEVTYIADTKNYIDQKIAPVIKSVVDTQKALL